MSRIIFNVGAAPAAPASGKESIFVNAEGRVQSIAATGVLRTISDGSRYNYVRNGGLWFAQRQAPATLTTYGATTARAIYGADGYSGYAENASVQYIRTDTSGAG